MKIPLTIGTPLTPAATKVMLLGSGELGKEVIIALQRLGVETIAVDRYADAPGHQVAHRSHVINMADGAALRAEIIRTPTSAAWDAQKVISAWPKSCKGNCLALIF